jgi:hypothetical protein
MVREYSCCSTSPYSGRQTGWVIWKWDSFATPQHAKPRNRILTGHCSAAYYTLHGFPASVYTSRCQISVQVPDVLRSFFGFSSVSEAKVYDDTSYHNPTISLGVFSSLSFPNLSTRLYLPYSANTLSSEACYWLRKKWCCRACLKLENAVEWK